MYTSHKTNASAEHPSSKNGIIIIIVINSLLALERFFIVSTHMQTLCLQVLLFYSMVLKSHSLVMLFRYKTTPFFLLILFHPILS
jgi:hypothetical protein